MNCRFAVCNELCATTVEQHPRGNLTDCALALNTLMLQPCLRPAPLLTSVAAVQGVAGLVLVAPAIVAMRLSRNELAAALDGVTDEVERDRVLAKFADFRSNTAGSIMCDSRLAEMYVGVELSWGTT